MANLLVRNIHHSVSIFTFDVLGEDDAVCFGNDIAIEQQHSIANIRQLICEFIQTSESQVSNHEPVQVTNQCIHKLPFDQIHADSDGSFFYVYNLQMHGIWAIHKTVVGGVWWHMKYAAVFVCFLLVRDYVVTVSLVSNADEWIHPLSLTTSEASTPSPQGS